MTAIVGFNCQDGVVIAADTEESYGDDKAYSHKLFPVKRPQSRLCVAGAGLGYLIDYANEEIVSAFDSGIKSVDIFQSTLAETLAKLYQTRFHHYPVDTRAELRMQLLVGVQFTKESDSSVWERPTLFECQSSTVVPIGRTRQSSILGVSEVLKQTAIQLAGWGLDVKLAEWASIYLVHQAKRRFGGVGGKTHFFSMKSDGSTTYNRGTNVIEKEEILDGFVRTCQLLMLSLEPSVAESRSKDFVDAAKRWLTSARKHLASVERETGKAKYSGIEIRSREIENMLRQLRPKRLIVQKSESEP